jgi:hypothetical protein
MKKGEGVMKSFRANDCRRFPTLTVTLAPAQWRVFAHRGLGRDAIRRRQRSLRVFLNTHGHGGRTALIQPKVQRRSKPRFRRIAKGVRGIIGDRTSRQASAHAGVGT